MFKGERTSVHYIGLIIFALACVGLFSFLWGAAHSNGGVYNLTFFVPYIFGSVVFIFVGFYMMISGFKKQTGT